MYANAGAGELNKRSRIMIDPTVIRDGLISVPLFPSIHLFHPPPHDSFAFGTADIFFPSISQPSTRSLESPRGQMDIVLVT